jgi:deoxyadenosine/deoxycytidine kinase
MSVGENRYLVIEGVIGAGKTSLSRMLSDRLASQLVLEEVEENPFLKDFYRDRARYAFQTQMHFCSAATSSSAICDRPTCSATSWWRITCSRRIASSPA